MNTATTAPAAPDPIEALNDFPDRLSPIVVKELRQGLRQPSFVILFLFLQSVLALAVISALFSVSSAPLQNRVGMGNVISGFFFVLFSLSVVVIQPLRALNVLSSEQRDSTIDLLLLTRLDAWRIVFGKWLSLVTQSALILVAMLPYLMMRYFLGGMNLLGELGFLTGLFLFGAMMCATGVAMSAVKSLILRVIFSIIGVVAFVVLLQSMSMFYMFASVSGGRPMGIGAVLGTKDWVFLVLGSVSLVAFVTHASLEFAATRIAPPAENRSTQKRIIALGALVLIPAMFAIPNVIAQFLVYFSMIVIGAVAMADALSENPRHVRRMKGFGMWALRPGWPSGAVFGLMVLGICALWAVVLPVAFPNRMSIGGDAHAAFMQVVGVCLFVVAQPALLVAILRPHEPEPAGVYLTVLLGSLALGLVLFMVGAATSALDTICMLFFIFFPILGLGMLDNPTNLSASLMFIAAAAYLCGAGWIGYRLWKPYLETLAPRPIPETPAEPPAESES